MHKTNMVTASYISPAMREMDAAAKEAGIVILNESGLDPGIDHLSAMKMIHGIQARGGAITGFSSLCGGLPAPEAANNPLGYKFSWSPRGVLTAARNAAQYLKNGEVVQVPGPQLLDSAEPVHINPAFCLEVLPNRDSLPYAELYGLQGISSMFRGTLRYRGFSVVMFALSSMGFLEVEPAEGYGEGQGKVGCRAAVAAALGADAGGSDEALMEAVVGFVQERSNRDSLSVDDITALNTTFRWLGLLDSETSMPQTRSGSKLDSLCALLTSKSEMSYAKGERDMALMHHVVTAAFPDGHTEEHHGTLIEYGIVHGDTAMARTVGITAAIGARMILDGTVSVRGVVAPLTPEWYEPMLAGLACEGIEMTETVKAT
jgi:saccharopine dehydrogenase-like NADP-dependent oxidoreductase